MGNFIGLAVVSRRHCVPCVVPFREHRQLFRRTTQTHDLWRERIIVLFEYGKRVPVRVFWSLVLDRRPCPPAIASTLGRVALAAVIIPQAMGGALITLAAQRRAPRGVGGERSAAVATVGRDLAAEHPVGEGEIAEHDGHDHCGADADKGKRRRR